MTDCNCIYCRKKHEKKKDADTDCTSYQVSSQSDSAHVHKSKKHEKKEKKHIKKHNAKEKKEKKHKKEKKEKKHKKHSHKSSLCSSKSTKSHVSTKSSCSTKSACSIKCEKPCSPKCGPTGPRGPTGPAGPAGDASCSRDWANLYLVENCERDYDVCKDKNVPFTAIKQQPSGSKICLRHGNRVDVKDSGYYLVSFGVNPASECHDECSHHSDCSDGTTGTSHSDHSDHCEEVCEPVRECKKGVVELVVKQNGVQINSELNQKLIFRVADVTEALTTVVNFPVGNSCKNTIELVNKSDCGISLHSAFLTIVKLN